VCLTKSSAVAYEFEFESRSLDTFCLTQQCAKCAKHKTAPLSLQFACHCLIAWPATSVERKSWSWSGTFGAGGRGDRCRAPLLALAAPLVLLCSRQFAHPHSRSAHSHAPNRNHLLACPECQDHAERALHSVTITSAAKCRIAKRGKLAPLLMCCEQLHNLKPKSRTPFDQTAGDLFLFFFYVASGLRGKWPMQTLEDVIFHLKNPWGKWSEGKLS
jgi:hypothetical protein